MNEVIVRVFTKTKVRKTWEKSAKKVRKEITYCGRAGYQKNFKLGPVERSDKQPPGVELVRERKTEGREMHDRIQAAIISWRRSKRGGSRRTPCAPRPPIRQNRLNGQRVVIGVKKERPGRQASTLFRKPKKCKKREEPNTPPRGTRRPESPSASSQAKNVPGSGGHVQPTDQGYRRRYL